MDTLLVTLALLLQLGDGMLTCQRLAAGTHRELNPVLGQTCTQIVAVKATATGLVLLLPREKRRWGLVALAAGGGIGIGVSVALDKDD